VHSQFREKAPYYLQCLSHTCTSDAPADWE
jgi:hypothetical protein